MLLKRGRSAVEKEKPAERELLTAGVGGSDEIVVTQIVLVFIWVSGLFRVGFSKPPYLDVQPPKEQKQQKTAFLIKIGKRFCHFLDTDREIIFDGPSGMSWGLIGVGDAGGRPAAGTEETIKRSGNTCFVLASR